MPHTKKGPPFLDTRARMRHEKLLQPEERCQLTCDGIRLRNGFAASLRPEKLDVYQLELKFLSWVTQFLADLSGRSLAPETTFALRATAFRRIRVLSDYAIASTGVPSMWL